MQIKLNYEKPDHVTRQAFIVAINNVGKLNPPIKNFSDKVKNIINSGDLSKEIGQTILMHHEVKHESQRLILVNCGDDVALKDSQFQSMVQKTLMVLRDTKAQEVELCLTNLEVKKRNLAWKIKQIVLLAYQVFYQFQTFKSKTGKIYSLKNIYINIGPQKDNKKHQAILNEAIATAEAVVYCKNLANTPPNICNPSYIAKKAKELAANYSKMSIQVLEENQMRALGMNALLSVAQGSATPPRFVVLQYKGGKAKQAPIALVGKGITFDTGGNTMKPGVGMLGMKFDMSGAATVISVIKAAADLKLPINVIAIMPCAENCVSGKATRPEDVIKTMSGQTVEINNTDAEGRLVLCDALTYCEKFSPELVIDVATLTGAIIIALGSKIAGMYSNDEELAEQLLSSSHESSDKLWRMPLVDDYQDNINSFCADFANSSIPNTEAGSILGAYFLSKFTKSFRWAHLDIAGVANTSGSQRAATGRPVPLLTQFLINYAAR